MNAWKMLSGLVSMVAAAAVLTSVLTTYKNFNDSTFQPSGLVILALAALSLGLAGIVQIVFRDGLIERARLVTVGLFVLAAVLFLITAVIALLDFNGWIQIITLIVWSLGCAAFAYVDYMWAYKISDSHLSTQKNVEEDEDEISPSDASEAPEGLSEEAAGDDAEAANPEDEASADSQQGLGDIPAIPDVDQVPTAVSDNDGDLSWDGVSGPPPRIA